MYEYARRAVLSVPLIIGEYDGRKQCCEHNHFDYNDPPDHLCNSFLTLFCPRDPSQIFRKSPRLHTGLLTEIILVVLIVISDLRIMLAYVSNLI